MQDVPLIPKNFISDSQKVKKSHGNKLIFFILHSGSLLLHRLNIFQYKSVAFAYRVAIQNEFLLLLYPLNDDDSLSQQLILFVIPFFILLDIHY